MSKTRDDDASPAEQAKQAEDDKQKKQKAIEELRANNKLFDSRGYRDLRGFKSRYKKADGTDFEQDVDTSGYSSVPGSRIKLELGVYEKEGMQSAADIAIKRKGKTRIAFDYDTKKDVFTFNVTLVSRVADAKSFFSLGIAGGDMKAREEPRWYQTWDGYAEDKANEAVKFAARVGMTSITPRFPERCDFISELGNIGPNTLQYHLVRMKSACNAARKAGIGIDTSDPGFSSFMSALQKYSMKEAGELSQAIEEANKNGKMYDKLNEFINPKSMQEHQQKLVTADKLVSSDRDAFKKEVDDAVKAQQAKVDKLQKQVDAETDPGKKKDLEDKLGLAKEIAERDRLVTEQANFKNEVDDPAKVPDKEALLQLKDKFNDFLNPDQKFSYAVKELKSALAEVKDRSAYTDPQKTKLDEFQATLDALESKLAKSPLSVGDRTDVENQLKTVIKEMDDLAKAKPDFKTKCETAIEKADQYVKGEKDKADSAQRIEDRIAALEKAAAELNNARAKYADYDPKDFVGMIVGKQVPLPPFRDQFVRLENSAAVQKYVDKNFNFPALETQRTDLQKAIEAEKTKLEVLADLHPKKAKEFQDRLAKIDVAPKPVTPKPGAGSSTVI